MSIYKMTTDSLKPLETSFDRLGLQEPQHLRPKIKDQIDIIEDILVIGEEFGDWEDSKRRIDILAVDKKGNSL